MIVVCVIGPVNQVIDACRELEERGYDPYASAGAGLAISQIRKSKAVLRVAGPAAPSRKTVDDLLEGYARELGRPVYISVDQMCAEHPSAAAAARAAARKKRTKA